MEQRFYTNTSFAIRIPKEKSLEQAKTHFSKVKGVLSVEKDEKVEINQ